MRLISYASCFSTSKHGTVGYAHCVHGKVHVTERLGKG